VFPRTRARESRAHEKIYDEQIQIFAADPDRHDDGRSCSMVIAFALVLIKMAICSASATTRQ